MKKFIAKHSDKIIGTLSCFDRIIIKGYLPISYPQSFQNFLSAKGVLLKDMKTFLPCQAARIKEHAQKVADKEGRPFIYINGHKRKEDEARKIAEEDNIKRGLICVYSVLEPCMSFKMVYGEGKPKLESARRKCLFYYFYYMDKELGLIHVRLQSWAPFSIQVYLNGHEWLSRKLDMHNIAYEKVDNAFLWISDTQRAQRFADQIANKKWPRILNSLARRVNLLLGDLLSDMSYYWVVDQAEYATDIMFKDRSSLTELYEKILRHSSAANAATKQGGARTKLLRSVSGVPSAISGQPSAKMYFSIIYNNNITFKAEY